MKDRTILRIIPFALAAAMAIPASAKAEAWVMEDVVTPNNLETVSVRISDGAEDGCWTNIGEARTYAQDKLTELGYVVVKDDQEADFRMSIATNVKRFAGECWGSIKIYLISRASLLNGYGFANAMIGGTGLDFRDEENANIIVLDYIKEMTDEMEKAAEGS